ncbi:MAG: radical SAM protein [Chitinispirillia bacterium]|nr:radical SAM protein [Chitinispirillia bacterium]
MNAFENKTAEQMEKWLDSWIMAIKNNAVSGFALSQNLIKNTYYAKEFGVNVVYDNNPELHGKTVDGFLVSSPESVRPDGKVVIFSDIGYINIKYILENKGLQEFDDFILWRNLIPVLKWVKKSELFIPEVHTAITTKCTLNCTNCNMLIPKHKQAGTDDFWELSCLKKDADLFFSIVDRCDNFQILGGEPLLYPHLGQYLKHVVKYRERIGKQLLIVSNGTIKPDLQILNICREYDISFIISNYSLCGTPNYSLRRDEVLQVLGRNNLLFSNNPAALPWSDFFLKGEGSAKHYQRCSPGFKGLNDGKFYSCHLVWSADKSNFLKAGTDDYLDLAEIKQKSNGKIELLKFNLGFHKNGFLNLCKVCGGCDPYFYEPIKPGKQ